MKTVTVDKRQAMVVGPRVYVNYSVGHNAGRALHYTIAPNPHLPCYWNCGAWWSRCGGRRRENRLWWTVASTREKDSWVWDWAWGTPSLRRCHCVLLSSIPQICPPRQSSPSMTSALYSVPGQLCTACSSGSLPSEMDGSFLAYSIGWLWDGVSGKHGAIAWERQWFLLMSIPYFPKAKISPLSSRTWACFWKPVAPQAGETVRNCLSH